MAPPGRQKSEREFCLFGGVFLRPARRAIWRAGRSCAASRCCGGFCARCPGVFSASAAYARGFFGTVCPVCLPCLCVRSSVLFWLSVCLFRVGCTHVFLLSFIFCLFLFGLCRANFFSFVAQAATGIPLLVPSRGFVPGLCGLSPAAFSRTFAPIACFSVLHCLCEFSLLFFCPFLPNFFLSNFFSFVAQAATGPFLLVPSRSFVPGLRVLSPAAFSRTFAPIACLPAVRFVLVVCSSVCVVRTGFLSLVFCPFLPNFFLSNFFSFVAQAATGLYFLPKRK